MNKMHTESSGEDYKKYLQSARWKTVKTTARKLYKTCVLCDSSWKLHVHYRHYKTFGREDITEDLILICERCHSLFHQFYIKTASGFLYEAARKEIVNENFHKFQQRLDDLRPQKPQKKKNRKFRSKKKKKRLK